LIFGDHVLEVCETNGYVILYDEGHGLTPY
jgi:hypothetical protein